MDQPEVIISEQDVADVAKWLKCSVDRVLITPAWMSIEEKRSTIENMLESYKDFPKDRSRTSRILKLISGGAALQPVFIEDGDPDQFVMEGRHRLVAFFQAGLSHIPVALVSCSADPIADFDKRLQALRWPSMPLVDAGPERSSPQL